MTDRYRLHYAPDNASLIVRLALEEMGLSYDTVLVNRAVREQEGAAYRALNPAGLIPVLETPDGPIFETAAILLWLADRHGRLAPVANDPHRGAVLKWLLFTSNTLHAGLRMTFYPDKYAGPNAAAQAAVRSTVQTKLTNDFRILDQALSKRGTVFWGQDTPSILDLYLAPLMRWSAIYPVGQTEWFDQSAYPALGAMAQALETRPATHAAQTAEGLGPTPFTAPIPADPPQGSAT